MVTQIFKDYSVLNTQCKYLEIFTFAYFIMPFELSFKILNYHINKKNRMGSRFSAILLKGKVICVISITLLKLFNI